MGDHLCEFVMTYAMMYRGDTAVRDTNVIGMADATFKASSPPRVFTAEDVDMLHEAMNLIMARRNDDGSFGYFFDKRHWRNKINMQLHVTSVCLRGIVLITRFPEIKDAYFTKEPEDSLSSMEVSPDG